MVRGTKDPQTVSRVLLDHALQFVLPFPSFPIPCLLPDSRPHMSVSTRSFSSDNITVLVLALSPPPPSSSSSPES